MSETAGRMSHGSRGTLPALQMRALRYNASVNKTRVLNVALVLAILAGLAVALFCALFVMPRMARLFGPPRIASTPVVLQQVQSLSQLVTVKYVLEKVVIIEDPKWFDTPLTDNRLLMVAHGIVKAGVDLGELKPRDVEVSGHHISLKLPPARITDSYLDDHHTEIIERTTGLLRSFDKDLEQNARRQAVMDINLAARENGILKDADERARAQLTQFFHMLGYDEVEFR